MDKHVYFWEQCHAYFDGCLSDEEREAFLSLVQSNSQYQADFEKFTALHQYLQSHGEVTPSESLENRILLALAKEEKQQALAQTSQPQKRWFIPLQIAAAVLLVAGVGMVFQFQPWGTGDAQREQVASSSGVLLPGGVPGTDNAPLSPEAALVQEILSQEEAEPGKSQPAAAEANADTALEEEMLALWSDTEALNQQVSFLDAETDWVSSDF